MRTLDSPQRGKGAKKKIGGAAVLALALLAGPVTAQDEGSAAPEPGFELIGDVAQKFTSTATDWSDAGATSWAFTADLKPKFTYGPASFQADTTWTLPMNASLTSSMPTVVIPEAYFRVGATDSLDLTFGQKRYPIGVGQTFTVGDSINPVIGFFDQKTGFRGATAEWSPVSWTSLSGAVSSEKSTAESPATVAGQASFLIDQLQLTASLVTRNEKTFNPALGVSYDFLEVIWTAEGAAEFLPQGLRPDSSAVKAWTAPDAWSSPALSGSVGARWAPTLGDWDLTFSAEYLHWAQGWNKDETDDWKDALAAAPPQVKPAVLGIRQTLPLRSQENAFFRFLISNGGVFSVSTFAAVDLQDSSVLEQGSVTWAPWDNLEFTATLQAAQGDEGSAWEFQNPVTQSQYQASFSTTYHF